MTVQEAWRDGYKPLTDPGNSLEAGESPLSRRLIMIWLLGTMVLLPVDLIKLPLNMLLVDCWILMGLPILWLFYVRGRYVISLSYVVAMWVILLASFASTFAAPAPENSLVVILKEIYAFVWFVTLVAILTKLSVRDFRRVLLVWSGIVFLHGFIIVGQFLSPDIWRLTVSLAGSLKEFEIYRPSGLFVNANSAAFFQLLGFVPLVLLSPPRKQAITLGLVLLLTMLLTGSMGATLALTTGVIVAVTALSLSGHLALIIKFFAQLAVVVLILGGILVVIVSSNQRYQEHIERILIGRSEKSSGGRFDLWQRGFDAYIEHRVLFWGVGPENFREVDRAMTDNQLHNDFIAFSVERGLLGTLGLVLFAVLAVSRAAYIVLIVKKYPDRGQLVFVAFLGAIIASLVESLTHQVFHFRELWLVLAFQEAILYKMMTSESLGELAPRALDGSPDHGRMLVVQPDVSGG